MRFEPDFVKVDASIPVHDKGLYQLKVAKVTPFAYEKVDEDLGEVKKIAGVRYGLTVVGVFDNKGKLDRTDEGRQVAPLRLYAHSEAAFGMAKQALMGMAGFSRNEEDEANAKFFAKNNWYVDGLDPDVTAGTGWMFLEGKIVNVILDKEVDTWQGQTRTSQTFSNWQPAKA